MEKDENGKNCPLNPKKTTDKHSIMPPSMIKLFRRGLDSLIILEKARTLKKYYVNFFDEY